MPWAPRRGLVVCGSRQRVRAPEQVSGKDRRGLAPSSHGASSSWSGTAGCGDAVDRQHGAVEDHVRPLPHGLHGLFQRGARAARRSTASRSTGGPSRSRRKNLLRDGRRCRLNAGAPGRTGPADHKSGDATGSRSDDGDLRGDRRGGGSVILVVNPSTRSLLHAHLRGCPSNHPSGRKRLTTSSRTSRSSPQVSNIKGKLHSA